MNLAQKADILQQVSPLFEAAAKRLRAAMGVRLEPPVIVIELPYDEVSSQARILMNARFGVSKEVREDLEQDLPTLESVPLIVVVREAESLISEDRIYLEVMSTVTVPRVANEDTEQVVLARHMARICGVPALPFCTLAEHSGDIYVSGRIEAAGITPPEVATVCLNTAAISLALRPHHRLVCAQLSMAGVDLE